MYIIQIIVDDHNQVRRGRTQSQVVYKKVVYTGVILEVDLKEISQN